MIRGTLSALMTLRKRNTRRCICVWQPATEYSIVYVHIRMDDGVCVCVTGRGTGVTQQSRHLSVPSLILSCIFSLCEPAWVDLRDITKQSQVTALAPQLELATGLVDCVLLHGPTYLRLYTHRFVPRGFSHLFLWYAVQ